MLREFARLRMESLLVHEQMVAQEQAYWMSRQRSNMQAALNHAFSLEKALQASVVLPPGQMLRMGLALRDYQLAAREVMLVDGGFRARSVTSICRPKPWTPSRQT